MGVESLLNIPEKKLEQKTSFWEKLFELASSIFSTELSQLQKAIVGNNDVSRNSDTKNTIVKDSSSSIQQHETKSASHDIDIHQKMSEYTPEKSRGLFEKIFGAGIATQLLGFKTNNSPIAMQRVMALASHEGGFHFGIRNPDPTKTGPNGGQLNRGTFQISGKDPEKKEAEAIAGLKKLTEGTPFAGINVDSLDTRQRELALWIGYINTRKNPTQIFADLSNPNLSDAQVVTLMSDRIQGGIADIGHDVVKKTKHATAGQYFAQMSKHGYEPIA